MLAGRLWPELRFRRRRRRRFRWQRFSDVATSGWRQPICADGIDSWNRRQSCRRSECCCSELDSVDNFSKTDNALLRKRSNELRTMWFSGVQRMEARKHRISRLTGTPHCQTPAGNRNSYFGGIQKSRTTGRRLNVFTSSWQWDAGVTRLVKPEDASEPQDLAALRDSQELQNSPPARRRVQVIQVHRVYRFLLLLPPPTWKTILVAFVDAASARIAAGIVHTSVFGFASPIAADCE